MQAVLVGANGKWRRPLRGPSPFQRRHRGQRRRTAQRPPATVTRPRGSAAAAIGGGAPSRCFGLRRWGRFPFRLATMPPAGGEPAPHQGVLPIWVNVPAGRLPPAPGPAVVRPSRALRQCLPPPPLPPAARPRRPTRRRRDVGSASPGVRPASAGTPPAPRRECRRACP